MKLQIIALAITILLPTVISKAKPVTFDFHPLSDELIDYINSLNSTWKAGRNFEKNIPIEHFIGLMGEYDEDTDEDDIPFLNYDVTKTKFPEEYDLREVYPDCPSLKEIRDQGSCGSCWAIAAVESMTDRTCILSKGRVKFHYSLEDVLSCCGRCGSCHGGRAGRAWKYWVENGIVSGGPYDSLEGCSPYSIPPCEHHMNGTRKPCTHGRENTPVCRQQCEKSYPHSYITDLHYGSSHYRLNGEDNIKADILKYGSVQSHFHVYEDFLHYKSAAAGAPVFGEAHSMCMTSLDRSSALIRDGVYQHVTGRRLGKHAIKLIGWGVQKSTNLPYWIAANSWNYDWGENGFFRIVRGQKGYILEHHVHAGIPSFS